METTSEVNDETKGTEVVVQRTFEKPVKEVWRVLMTDDGAEILLGPGAMFGAKGDKWKSRDGREGVIRSFHPLEQIRFSWRLPDYKEPAMVSVNLSEAADDQCLVVIRHEHDNVVDNREWFEEHWDGAMERLESELL